MSTAPKHDLDNLRARIHEDALALAAGDELCEDRVQALERRSRLADIIAATRPPPRRLLTLGALLGSLLLGSLLFFVRVSETEIELDLTVSALDGLRFDGLKDVTLSPLTQFEKKLIPKEGQAERLKLEVVAGEGSITLSKKELNAGSSVRIEKTDIANHYRVMLAGELPKTLDAMVKGKVRINNRAEKQLSFPEQILCVPGSGPVYLDLFFPNDKPTFLGYLPQVEALDFKRIDLLMGRKNPMRELSTLVDGTLYYQALNGKKQLLRTGQHLDLDVSRGWIRDLSMEKGLLKLKFNGTVKGMETGLGNKVNLMPSLLQWLAARHSLQLFWGSLL